MQQGNVKKSEKPMKVVNIEGKNLRIFWTTLKNDIFRKNMVYDDIKSHQKSRVSLSVSLEDRDLEKPKVGQIDRPAFSVFTVWDNVL